MVPNRAIEIAVRKLFDRQSDVAADGAAAGFLRTTVSGFHNSWPAASHDRETQLAQPSAHLARERIVGILFGEARRPEHRHARTDEMKRPESADEIADGAPDEQQLLAPGVRPFEEYAVRGRTVAAEGCLRFRCGRRGVVHHLTEL
jgi:hypothetical protein